MKKPIVIVIALLTFLSSCTQKETAIETDIDTTTFHLDWDAMAAMLMRRANIEPGEKVLLVASPGRFEGMIPLLKEKIETSKGEYLGTISVDTANWPQAWKSTFVNGVTDLSVDAMAKHFKGVDLAIMMPGANVSHPPY